MRKTILLLIICLLAITALGQQPSSATDILDFVENPHPALSQRERDLLPVLTQQPSSATDILDVVENPHLALKLRSLTPALSQGEREKNQRESDALRQQLQFKL